MSNEVRAFEFRGSENGHLVYLGDMFVAEIVENGIRFTNEALNIYFNQNELNEFIKIHRRSFG